MHCKITCWVATIAWDAAAAIAGLPAPICPNVYDKEDGTVREFAGLVSRREGDATSPLLVEFEAMDVDFCLEVLTLLNGSCLSEITKINVILLIHLDR